MLTGGGQYTVMEDTSAVAVPYIGTHTIKEEELGSTHTTTIDGLNQRVSRFLIFVDEVDVSSVR